MRKIKYAEWLENVQRGTNLTPDEQEELRRWTKVPQAPKTWEEYEELAVRLGELVAKANGCECLKDVRSQYRLVVENFRKASNGNLALLQDFEHPAHQEHWKCNTALAIRYARKRKCHGLMRGFVCYCDEHKH